MILVQNHSFSFQPWLKCLQVERKVFVKHNQIVRPRDRIYVFVPFVCNTGVSSASPITIIYHTFTVILNPTNFSCYLYGILNFLTSGKQVIFVLISYKSESVLFIKTTVNTTVVLLYCNFIHWAIRIKVTWL